MLIRRLLRPFGARKDGLVIIVIAVFIFSLIPGYAFAMRPQAITEQARGSALGLQQEIAGALTTSEWIKILDNASALLANPVVQNQSGLGIIAELRDIYDNNFYVVSAQVSRYLSVMRKFESEYGPGPAIFVRAPGRSILMGSHNDYNWGPELLMTLPVDIIGVVRPRHDTLVRLASTDAQFANSEFDIKRELPPQRRGDWEKILHETGVPPQNWANYIKGSVLFWQNYYPEESFTGMDVMIDGTLPMERAISSSSALVVIGAIAINLVNGKPLDKQKIADFSCFAEWYVGTRGGGLDHAISTLGEKGQVLQMTPDSRDIVSIKLPQGYSFILADSLVPSDKTGSVRNFFNQRSAETRLFAVELFKALFPEYAARVEYLRDITSSNLGVSDKEIDLMISQLPEVITTAELAKELPPAVMEEFRKSYQGLPEPTGGWKIQRRVRHIVNEIRRVKKGTTFMQNGDMNKFGGLMNKAYRSYRDDYEITVPQLRELIELSTAVPGVLGANLQGGGFGGIAVILVKDGAVDKLIDYLVENYYKPRGLDLSAVLKNNIIFKAVPSSGADLVVPQAAGAAGVAFAAGAAWAEQVRQIMPNCYIEEINIPSETAQQIKTWS